MAKKKPDYTEAQKLRDQGMTIKSISELTGLCRHGIGQNTTKTVKPSLKKNKRIDYDSIQKMRDKGITVQHISKTLGVSKTSIFTNTRAPIFKPSKEVPEKIFIDQSDMEKGHAKIRKSDRILKTKLFDTSKQRFIYIREMNMTVAIKSSDTRTDDEIREFWLSKQLGEANRLKKNTMNENYLKSFKK